MRERTYAISAEVSVWFALVVASVQTPELALLESPPIVGCRDVVIRRSMIRDFVV